MLSQKLRTFFVPIIVKHKRIFLLSLLGAFITGTVSVITPLLLKAETDQLVEKGSLLTSFWELSGFYVFMLILFGLLLIETVERVIRWIVNVTLESQKDYLENEIQLTLLRHMNEMEVWRVLNGRFKNLANILEREFSSFSNTVINFPSSFLERAIQVVGVTATFVYFDVRLLGAVLMSSVISYYIDKYSHALQSKYRIHWSLSLGQKVYFYKDLFLRKFSQLAMNGAVSTSLLGYEELLKEQIRIGLKREWSGLVWSVSSLLTGELSRTVIKAVVGYGVFQGTHSLGMVALVIASMTMVNGIMRVAY